MLLSEPGSYPIADKVIIERRRNNLAFKLINDIQVRLINPFETFPGEIQ